MLPYVTGSLVRAPRNERVAVCGFSHNMPVWTCHELFVYDGDFQTGFKTIVSTHEGPNHQLGGQKARRNNSQRCSITPIRLSDKAPLLRSLCQNLRRNDDSPEVQCVDSRQRAIQRRGLRSLQPMLRCTDLLLCDRGGGLAETCPLESRLLRVTRRFCQSAKSERISDVLMRMSNWARTSALLNAFAKFLWGAGVVLWLSADSTLRMTTFRRAPRVSRTILQAVFRDFRGYVWSISSCTRTHK